MEAEWGLPSSGHSMGTESRLVRSHTLKPGKARFFWATGLRSPVAEGCPYPRDFRIGITTRC